MGLSFGEDDASLLLGAVGREEKLAVGLLVGLGLGEHGGAVRDLKEVGLGAAAVDGVGVGLGEGGVHREGQRLGEGQTADENREVGVGVVNTGINHGDDGGGETARLHAVLLHFLPRVLDAGRLEVPLLLHLGIFVHLAVDTFNNRDLLGGEDVVIFGSLGQQVTGAGNGQLLVAEDHETGNGQLFIAWGTASKTFDANTKEYAALNATDIVGVFVDKATGNISEVLEVTYETEDDVYGDENPRAAYDEETGHLMIWYNKCEYSDGSDPYSVLSYRLYDMRVREFLDMGDSPDGDWYGQVLVGVNPVVTAEETLDASGYWAETPEFTEFYGWDSCAVEFDAIQFNGQSLLAYVIDYDLNRSTTDDRDVYVLAYNFEDNSITHPIMIANTDAAESNVEFRDVDGKLCLSYLSDGQEITFNISDNFSNANVLREDVTDDGVFYYYINKSADSGYIPATVAAKHTVSFAANEGSGSMTPVEVEDGTEYTLPACTFTAPSNKTFKAWSVGGEEKQPGDKITVSANTTVTAVWQNLVKYDLWVGGVQVTNANASNITGEGITGAVSYDSTTKTLTLNNATITGVHEFSIFDDVSGIYGKETLKINLIGNNTITGSDNGGSSYGIYIDNRNLTFTGTGSLTVSAADLSENNWSVAVFADGSITVEESCTITAYCGTNAWVASAFKSYAGSNEYNLPNATGILVAGNKNAPEATNFEVCNGDPDEFQYLRIAPGYTVTLNKDGGTINSGNVTCYFVDTGATLPTEVTKANSIFGGWYDNAECTGTAITEIPVGSTGEKEYWAKWTAVHTCSIEPVEKVWPDCENGGKEAYYKCEGCGKFFEDANGTTEIANIETWGNLPKNGHDWNTASWEKDATGHWHKCNAAGCTEKSDFAQHTPDRAEATETDPVKCSVCEYEITPALGHTHAHGTEWKSDEDNHWNECACGDKANTAAHKDENADGKCDVCAYNVGLPTTPDDGNKPSDIPQTGDNTQLGLWIALLIVSSFGIVAITLFGKKKYSAR